MNELDLDIEVEVLEDRIAPSLLLTISPTGGREIRFITLDIRENSLAGIRAANISPVVQFTGGIK